MKKDRDFYIENGLYVFTGEYLKRRGYCCDNGCRHCPYVFSKRSPRVVSLVPSWTDTLVSAGIHVVGRTRYCIHPKPFVSDIPIVGGTKTCDYKKIDQLAPDFVILDKEENPKEFAENIEIQPIITHVVDHLSLFRDLGLINSYLKSQKINELIVECEKINNRKSLPLHHWSQLPGIMKWIRQPETKSEIHRVVYVIWKNPWMRISQDTFIGAQLSKFGLKTLIEPGSNKYPVFQMEEYDPSTTLFLFSSEPFPFAKNVEEVEKSGLFSALVDGESYSWFGRRGIEFLARNIPI